ncbi:DNA mismatch repair endonuclease MutL [Alkalicoccus chagannorensis]|uniref:DNA mismatch repair endonuclease MutL n=1 Tax=Alkalicoccus chagannorensis TaxID=427072 RepID=UPI0003F826A9|nr:DNA mismatch repair endonuclease MutL [Alkalicoccus chagannorensis]
MADIQKLDDHLSNKIAAGEVVERPASVVKELVENAVDAGSTSIRIEAEEGGLQLIRVMDNGRGIAPDDRETAFERHATSKIKTDRDLFRIQSLGFRGEALPSIASVSDVTLTTSTDGLEGEQLVYRGGSLKSRKAAPPRQGTDIVVRELFFNTPARLKYVKTIHTELGHLSDVVNRQAMARPDIAFTLVHQGRELLRTTGSGSMQQVMMAVYGHQAAKGMTHFEAENEDFHIQGYAGSPSDYRANRSYITTIINGRFVKSIAAARAVTAGYDSLLPIGRFPIICLHITLHPLLVDVNVHPSKLEVRLSKEKELQQLIEETLRRQWKQEAVIPEPAARKPKPASEQQTLFEAGRAARDPQIKETFVSFAAQEKRTPDPSPSSYAEQQTESAEEDTAEHVSFQESAAGEQAAAKEGDAVRVPEMDIVGQVHGTYIILQNEQGMYMIDQHAAQERINYEFYYDKLASPQRDQQEMLVPIMLETTVEEEVFFTEHLEELAEAGVFLEPFGPRTFRIPSVPAWFPAGAEKECIDDIIEQLRRDKEIHIGRLRDDAAAMMACKKAVKANHHLSRQEMTALVDNWRHCRDPFTCPHGRPVMVHYSVYELEKMFQRVMNS